MKLNELVESTDLTEKALYVGAYFGDTLNLINVVDIINFDLGYEVIKTKVEDEIEEYAIITKHDYLDLIERMNNA